MKDEAEYLQAMENLKNSLNLLDYFVEFRKTDPGQGMLDALRLVYKRTGQAGAALVAKLGEDFTPAENQ